MFLEIYYMLIGNQYGCILLYCSVEEGFWDLLYLFLMTFVMVFFFIFQWLWRPKRNIEMYAHHVQLKNDDKQVYLIIYIKDDEDYVDDTDSLIKH